MKKNDQKKDKQADKDAEIQNPDVDIEETNELQKQLEELRDDLQRVRADFENYRRRTEADLERARTNGKASAVLGILPVIDNIERAISHAPQDLKDNKWAQGVMGLTKNLDKSMQTLGIERIDAHPGTSFDPELHEAVSSEEGDGDEEVIAEELQAGYKLGGRVIRHSMVKVKSQ